MIFFRYVVIQLLAYVIDMGVFLFVLHFGIAQSVWGNVMSKFAAGLFAFFAHRHFTFRVAGGVAASGQAIRYFFVLVLNIPVATAILALLQIWFAEPVVAKFIADVICVGLTYLLSKHLIFTGHSKKVGSAGVGV
jgi:putative flippase GtrA